MRIAFSNQTRLSLGRPLALTKRPKLQERPPRATWYADTAGKSADQESAVLWQFEQRNLLTYLDRLDPALRQMAELMLLHDMTATADLSRSLCIVPAEVANRRRRLKRAVRAYLAESDS